MGWKGRGQAGRKREVGEEREEGRKEGKEGECIAMSPSENSFKIHWLQMHQNPFSAGALPRTPLRELATLPKPLVDWGSSPTLYPSCLEAFGVSISSPHQRRLGS